MIPNIAPLTSDLDLRQEMSELLQNYGLYVLLERKSHKVHCRCWNEKYQEGRHDCTICGGSGWYVRLERHLTRNQDANMARTEAHSDLQSGIGRSYTLFYQWWFKHDAYPQVGDIIYEVNWDLNNPQKPVSLVASHEINSSIPNRGDRGRIEFWDVVSRSDTTNNAIRNKIVRSVGPIQNYVLLTG